MSTRTDVTGSFDWDNLRNL